MLAAVVILEVEVVDSRPEELPVEVADVVVAVEEHLVVLPPLQPDTLRMSLLPLTQSPRTVLPSLLLWRTAKNPFIHNSSRMEHQWLHITLSPEFPSQETMES